MLYVYALQSFCMNGGLIIKENLVIHTHLNFILGYHNKMSRASFKALCLVSNLQWAETADTASSYSYLAMHRATPMYYINGKGHN